MISVVAIEREITIIRLKERLTAPILYPGFYLRTSHNDRWYRLEPRWGELRRVRGKPKIERLDSLVQAWSDALLKEYASYGYVQTTDNASSGVEDDDTKNLSL